MQLFCITEIKPLSLSRLLPLLRSIISTASLQPSRSYSGLPRARFPLSCLSTSASLSSYALPLHFYRSPSTSLLITFLHHFILLFFNFPGISFHFLCNSFYSFIPHFIHSVPFRCKQHQPRLAMKACAVR